MFIQILRAIMALTTIEKVERATFGNFNSVEVVIKIYQLGKKL